MDVLLVNVILALLSCAQDIAYMDLKMILVLVVQLALAMTDRFA
jgi:hypothetical protein